MRFIILGRSTKGKQVRVAFTIDRGFMFINRRPYYYYMTIHASQPLPKDKDLEAVIKSAMDGDFIKDSRLPNGYTHRIDLTKYPKLNFKLKEIGEDKYNKYKDAEKKAKESKADEKKEPGETKTDSNTKSTLEDDEFKDDQNDK